MSEKQQPPPPQQEEQQQQTTVSKEQVSSSLSTNPTPLTSGGDTKAATSNDGVVAMAVDKQEDENTDVARTGAAEAGTTTAAAAASVSSAAATTVASASSNGDNNNTNSVAADTSGDATMAQVLYAVETLTQLFGFSPEVASEAVEAVGIDVTTAYNYILDNGLGKDKGGAITPITNCQHLQDHVKLSPQQLCEFVKDPKIAPCDYFDTITTNNNSSSKSQSQGSSSGGGKAKVDIDETTGKCPLGENWLCLECGVVRCSRYVNGHGILHWEETKTNNNGDGHCICVSFADLSIWCHVCSAYLRHSTLDPLVQRLEHLKFSNDDDNNKNSNNNNEDHIERGEPKMKRARSSDLEEMETTGANDKINSTAPTVAPTTTNSTVSSSSTTTTTTTTTSTSNNISNNARGLPINLGGDNNNDDEEDEYVELEFPFGSKVPSTLKEIAEFIKSDECRSIVILTGAGMSVRSGIPDFRSKTGLYATMDPDKLTADPIEREAIRMDPSVALEQGLFMNNPLPCLELNRTFILGTKNQQWKATLAHRFVELLHTKLNKLVRLYTQNIDGLEDQCTLLPRNKVVNVHGTMDRAECAMCYSEGDFELFCNQIKTQIKDLSGVDKVAPIKSTPISCNVCGYNAMKPAIVLFKSSLPQRFFELVPKDIHNVDMLIVIGTSLRVAPANSLVWRVPETTLRLVINRDPVGYHLGIDYTSDDPIRDYFANGDIDTTVLDLMTYLDWLDDLKPLLNDNKLPESSEILLRERILEVEKEQN